MAKKPNYSYVLSVVNQDTGEEIAHRSSSSLEILEQSLGDPKKWIENWERENLVECFECQQMSSQDDISYSKDYSKEERAVCQDCIARILAGDQQPREI